MPHPCPSPPRRPQAPGKTSVAAASWSAWAARRSCLTAACTWATVTIAGGNIHTSGGAGGRRLGGTSADGSRLIPAPCSATRSTPALASSCPWTQAHPAPDPRRRRCRFPDFGPLSRSGRFTEAVDALFVTHFHLDHVGALPYFSQARLGGAGARSQACTWGRSTCCRRASGQGGVLDGLAGRVVAACNGVGRRSAVCYPLAGSLWVLMEPDDAMGTGAGLPGTGLHDVSHARNCAHHARRL